MQVVLKRNEVVGLFLFLHILFKWNKVEFVVGRNWMNVSSLGGMRMDAYFCL